MKHSISFICALVLVSAVPAFAQMMGNGQHGGNMNGNMNGLIMGAMAASGAMGGGLLVGPDGTVYTLRIADAAAGSVPAGEVVAVRPSGAIGWTATVAAGMPSLALSGSDLIVATRTMGSAATPSSTLAALSTASGAQRWVLQLDGIVMDIEPFAGGTYVTLIKFPATSGGSGGMMGRNQPGTGATRSLLAVGSDGRVLWTLQLTK